MEVEETPGSQTEKLGKQPEVDIQLFRQPGTFDRNRERDGMAVASTCDKSHPLVVALGMKDRFDETPGKEVQRMEEVSGGGGSHAQVLLTEGGVSSRSRSSVGPCYAVSVDRGALAEAFGDRCETTVGKEMSSSTASGSGYSSALAIAPAGGYAAASSSCVTESRFGFLNFDFQIWNRLKSTFSFSSNNKALEHDGTMQSQTDSPSRPIGQMKID